MQPRPSQESLPDTFGRVDDGLHNVVPDELPVFVRNVGYRGFCTQVLPLTPVLSYHVLQVDHT